jgi:hypothetical protein
MRRRLIFYQVFQPINSIGDFIELLPSIGAAASLLIWRHLSFLARHSRYHRDDLSIFIFTD